MFSVSRRLGKTAPKFRSATWHSCLECAIGRHNGHHALVPIFRRGKQHPSEAVRPPVQSEASSAPMLRAVLDSGVTWDDPSEDLLYELLADVDRGEEQYVIVERTLDEAGQTYAQVVKDDRTGWIVERREGGPEAHFSVSVPGLVEAHHILTSWAFELPDETSWEQVHL